MNNRIKKYLDPEYGKKVQEALEKALNQPAEAPKKNPPVEEGQWVTVHLCFGGAIAESEDDVSGIHVVLGKMALSESVAKKLRDGTYSEVESMSMQIESEAS